MFNCIRWIPHWLILTLIKCFIIQVTPLKHYTIFIKLSYLSPVSILSTTSPRFFSFLQVAENTPTDQPCPNRPMLLRAHSLPCLPTWMHKRRALRTRALQGSLASSQCGDLWGYCLPRGSSGIPPSWDLSRSSTAICHQALDVIQHHFLPRSIGTASPNLAQTQLSGTRTPPLSVEKAEKPTSAEHLGPKAIVSISQTGSQLHTYDGCHVYVQRKGGESILFTCTGNVLYEGNGQLCGLRKVLTIPDQPRSLRHHPFPCCPFMYTEINEKGLKMVGIQKIPI